MANTQAKSKIAGKTATEKGIKKAPEATNAQVLCVIPQTAIQELFDWLNSDHQLMPQCELRRAMALLNGAKLLEQEPE